MLPHSIRSVSLKLDKGTPERMVIPGGRPHARKGLFMSNEVIRNLKVNSLDVLCFLLSPRT